MENGNGLLKRINKDVEAEGLFAAEDEDVSMDPVDDDHVDNALASKANDPAWDAERRHYQKVVSTFKRYR